MKNVEADSNIGVMGNGRNFHREETGKPTMENMQGIEYYSALKMEVDALRKARWATE